MFVVFEVCPSMVGSHWGLLRGFRTESWEAFLKRASSHAAVAHRLRARSFLTRYALKQFDGPEYREGMERVPYTMARGGAREAAECRFLFLVCCLL